MQMTKIQKILITILIALVLFGGYVYFDRTSKVGSGTVATTTGGLATTTGSKTYTDSQGLTYTITPVSNQKPASTLPQPIPDLNRPVTKFPGATVSEANMASAQLKVKELQSALKADPKAFVNWMDLGMYQKLGGDYEGALISWKYASRLVPTDFVSLGNIGNLYAYEIRDNIQSEIYYKQAIGRGPKEGYLYYQLGEVYRDFFHDIAKARAIADQGLSQNPTDEVLLQFKAGLK